MKIILDSSAVIAFLSELNRPKLLSELNELGYILLIPNSVFQEIKKGRTFPMLQESIQNKAIILSDKNDSKEIQKLKYRYPALHDGEIEVILKGMKLNESNDEYFCVIDERPARKIANQCNIKIVYTIELLDILEEKGIIKDKNELVKKLKEAGFYVK
jgi:predicted nucleic acid-binding protein